MSGTINGPNDPVLDNSFPYPYGTTEQFPQMEDSDLNKLENSAHYYMECSNKGVCDRTTGECVCYDGYDGVACQRASCPGYPVSCSGHGVCKSKKQLAFADYENIYKLWDKDSTMGCECDAGYSGPDCSERNCKYGVDPLYLDDSATIKYSVFDFGIITTDSTAYFTDGTTGEDEGYWAIRFYDMHGEDWLTTKIRAGATCDEVTDALEQIPNNVIPKESVLCTLTSKTDEYLVSGFDNGWENIDQQTAADGDSNLHTHDYYIKYNMDFWEAVVFDYYGLPFDYRSEGGKSKLKKDNDDDKSTSGGQAGADFQASGYIYRLKFFGNPGQLRQPEIEIYLDGKKPTLQSPDELLITSVWTDGQQGESKDLIADHCEGVTVTIASAAGHEHVSYLDGLTVAEIAKLKTCLGDADFDVSNNRDVFNWDYGNQFYPHLIKLVKAVTTYSEGGYYSAVYWETDGMLDDITDSRENGRFVLLNPFRPNQESLADPEDDNIVTATEQYEVYTTKGTFALTSNQSEVTASFGSQTIYIVNASYDVAGSSYDGDISCEVGANNAAKLEHIQHCLNKTDLFTYLNWEAKALNPRFFNLYTAEKLYSVKPQKNVNGLYFEDNDYVSRVAYDDSKQQAPAHYMNHRITTDLSTNYGVDQYHSQKYLEKNGATNGGPNDAYFPNPHPFRIYKFFPHEDSTYEYVAQCSNRGICQRDTGLCTCFPGYTSDDCSVQNAIAL